MRGRLIALVASSVMSATSASAQVLNLSGPYQCLQVCRRPAPAIVTQSGWDLNLVNETGMPSRAWVDWPGHTWAENWNLGALYSPDGLTIQFDNGAVWRRILPSPVLNSRD